MSEDPTRVERPFRQLRRKGGQSIQSQNVSEGARTPGVDDSPAARMAWLRQVLDTRFADVATEVVEAGHAATAEMGLEAVEQMSAHAACRAFDTTADIPVALLRFVAAVALSAPSKSDLQQRDIIIVSDDAIASRLKALVADQAWTAGAPRLVIFCGNNRRQRRLHALRGHTFANDHLDAFFNASVDAGIALGAFITAAEALGLGTCPISAIRNDAQAASDILGLPEHVFPVAGLAVGWPADGLPTLSPRLPLGLTVHENGYDESAFDEGLAAYDARRAEIHPYKSQRRPELGKKTPYTWSEDKARQYSLPERADFGAFIRAKGFKLD